MKFEVYFWDAGRCEWSMDSVFDNFDDAKAHAEAMVEIEPTESLRIVEERWIHNEV